MIWLIGGTSESVIIGKLIAQNQGNFIVSVTTDNARNLYQSIASCQIFVGKLSLLTIPDFIQRHHITKVIDCSHPFASQISRSVINICQYFQLPYLRYERPCIAPISPLVTFTFSPDSLVSENSPLKGKRVLLTIGAKYLYIFQDYHSRAALFTRILPYPQSLNLAYQAGFSCDRIIALRPPLSQDIEKALWQLWNIEIVVTKAGGKAGGQEIKYRVAQELNTPLIVISRPQITYPQVTSNLDSVKAFAQP